MAGVGSRMCFLACRRQTLIVYKFDCGRNAQLQTPVKLSTGAASSCHFNLAEGRPEGIQMAPSLAAGVISLNDFQEVLSRYDALIQSVSKPSNKDGKGLQELDIYRLVTVPTRLEKVRQEGGELYLEKEEVESLIRWKLYV
jgi:hypothetical protein